eukprot:3305531-Alexandrium_andersonii.AAC.1
MPSSSPSPLKLGIGRLLDVVLLTIGVHPCLARRGPDQGQLLVFAHAGAAPEELLPMFLATLLRALTIEALGAGVAVLETTTFA